MKIIREDIACFHILVEFDDSVDRAVVGRDRRPDLGGGAGQEIDDRLVGFDVEVPVRADEDVVEAGVLARPGGDDPLVDVGDVGLVLEILPGPGGGRRVGVPALDAGGRGGDAPLLDRLEVVVEVAENHDGDAPGVLGAELRRREEPRDAVEAELLVGHARGVRLDVDVIDEELPAACLFLQADPVGEVVHLRGGGVGGIVLEHNWQ